MIIDKLYEKVEQNGVVCLGLDTSIDYIPEFFKNKFDNKVADYLFAFNKEIIDETLDVVSCFKVQIAYYEALGLEGLMAYKRTLEYLREKEAISIADIKRGDIAATATMYAKAHFEGDFEADFITLSPYMGMDSIEPYMPYFESGKKGAFVLVRTSNKGAQDIEFVKSEESKTIYDIVGEKITTLGESSIGTSGYSAIGGVIGCTHSENAEKIRDDFKNMFFLIPGYGAQGGKVEDVAKYLNNGNGGVVNSSRKILLAYKEQNDELNFAKYSRHEAIRMRDEIKSVVEGLK